MLGNRIIILFGGIGAERLVSVASAKNISRYTPNYELWFWSKKNHFYIVSNTQLSSHDNPFENEFLPIGIPFAHSVEELIDIAVSEKRLLFLALHGSDGGMENLRN